MTRPESKKGPQEPLPTPTSEAPTETVLRQLLGAPYVEAGDRNVPVVNTPSPPPPPPASRENHSER